MADCCQPLGKVPDDARALEAPRGRSHAVPVVLTEAPAHTSSCLSVHELFLPKRTQFPLLPLTACLAGAIPRRVSWLCPVPPRSPCDRARRACCRGGTMDLAYVCEWEKWPKSTHCPSGPLACAWSCRNLIAFTTDLRSDDQDLTRMIHILDTEHPWDVHSIPSEHSEAITCVGSVVEGDPIVALSWLHNGVKLALHVEKSGVSSFGEKFSRVKFSPSLTLFGGKPMEGWIAVTVSGLVTVSLLKPSGQVLTSTESLCRLRGRVALADIAFTGGGNIVVATADGSSASPVQFYKVCVGVVSEKCRVDTELLVLASAGHHGQASVGDKPPMILKWRILSATNDLDRVSAVALPKLPISLTNTDLKVASDTQFYPGLGLALAFHDGSVHVVHRLSLQTMAVFYSSAAPRPVDEPALKRPRTAGPAVHFKAMQLSWTSLALVGVDNYGKLSVLRVSPSMGHPLDVGLALRHLLFLLEYCMVTGYDWWDILLHVQPGMVQSLVEKLHEEYT
ncbi:mediator of RNA polymerase II transcription subunit 16, partial [Carlito syrichta]|uniref:Mediator of RNA polymerase II transcription subunit 16 n=1 Tax=Carlito syrichta TaxID=1868482 RepID=A0A3Q0DLY1_CARSF